MTTEQWIPTKFDGFEDRDDGNCIIICRADLKGVMVLKRLYTFDTFELAKEFIEARRYADNEIREARRLCAPPELLDAQGQAKRLGYPFDADVPEKL